MAFSDSDKILIVGANSSVASAFISEVTRFNPIIIGTFREDTHDKSSAFLQQVFFDLADLNSLDRFVEYIAPESFHYIYIFVGATSGIDTKNGLLASISDYYSMYSARLNYLLGKLGSSLQVGGTMVFLSSRAAHRSSYDSHYSAAKSSNEGFLLSLSALTQDKRILVLAPSLIEDSTMYSQMSENTIKNHRERTRNQLLTMSEVVDKLIEMSMNTIKYPNGSIECIGRDW